MHFWIVLTALWLRWLENLNENELISLQKLLALQASALRIDNLRDNQSKINECGCDGEEMNNFFTGESQQ